MPRLAAAPGEDLQRTQVCTFVGRGVFAVGGQGVIARLQLNVYRLFRVECGVRRRVHR